VQANLLELCCSSFNPAFRRYKTISRRHVAVCLCPTVGGKNALVKKDDAGLADAAAAAAAG
jgi:hypothetical protein